MKSQKEVIQEFDKQFENYRELVRRELDHIRIGIEEKKAMTVKPIFAIGLPKDASDNITDEQRDRIMKKMPEYHVIIYPSSNGGFNFEAFYEKPITDIEFEELKVLVLSELKA